MKSSYLKIIIALSIAEINSIHENDSGQYTTPGQFIYSALIKDFQRGRIDSLKSILERVFSELKDNFEMKPEQRYFIYIYILLTILLYVQYWL